jgi:hypothetical protein
MNKIYTAIDIENMLRTNNFAVERALTVLYARQTADEQISKTTNNNNGCGFNMIDAEIFSSFAEQVAKSRYPKGQRLSPKQFGICRKENKHGRMKIAKYVNQLLEVANANKVMEAGAA